MASKRVKKEDLLRDWYRIVVAPWDREIHRAHVVHSMTIGPTTIAIDRHI